MRVSIPGWRWPSAVISITALTMLAGPGCREDERSVSGDSWNCLCVVEPTDTEIDVNVCALSAGEASQIATPCVASELAVAVRFCDCIVSTRPFCEPGECVIR